MARADIAVADYAAEIERDPNYAVAFNCGGRAYLALNDTAHAVADFNETIRLDGKLGATYCNRAFLHEAAGRMDEANADFGRAIETEPNKKDVLYVLVHYFLKLKQPENQISTDPRNDDSPWQQRYPPLRKFGCVAVSAAPGLKRKPLIAGHLPVFLPSQCSYARNG
jgi:tetratricopeptide (TPR) repeat protein